MGKLNIGWSEANITPDKKVSLYGQFAERISEYVEKPISATALAIENGEDQVILVSCDLVAVTGELTQGVREALTGNTVGIDPMKVVLSATHIHTGPGYARAAESAVASLSDNRKLLESMLPEGRKYVEAADMTGDDIATGAETYDMLVERITAAILDAWTKREAGSFTNAFGRAVVGMCRRAAYSDDTAQMWGDTNTAVFTELEGGNDSGIELMYIRNAAGELTGVVANLACPAQCVQHRLFVSPDFWGEAKMLLRKHFGENFFMLPLCSAAGDQCPVDLVRWVEPESDVHDPNITRNNPPKRKADPSMFDLAGMRKAGKRVANEIIEVYNEGLDEPQEDVQLIHHVHNMQLPLRRATMSENKAAERAIKDYLRDTEGDVNYYDSAMLQVHLGLMGRYRRQEVQDIVDTEVHVIRLGSIAIATNPFELFLDYGNQIKARALCEQTFLIQLAVDSLGYLPTEKAERHGHYSAFISSGKVGHIGGEQLVRETLKDINNMFKE